MPDGEDNGCGPAGAGLRDSNGPELVSVKEFTWKQLSKLNSRHNAHVAYRGKVYRYIPPAII